MKDIPMVDRNSLQVKLVKAKKRLDELARVIKEANEEKGYIEYMLAQFPIPENIQSQSNLPINKREIYIEVFKEHKEEILHTDQILALVEQKGFKVEKATHYANLSVFNRELKTPIRRVKIAYYIYDENKQKQPSIL